MHRLLYTINTLNVGGAEQQLLELVRGLDKREFHPIVAPLYSGGGLAAEFRAVPGAELVDLSRHSKYDPSPLVRIARLLRARRIDIVQPFLTPAAFFSLLPAVLVGTPIRVVTERSGSQRFRHLGFKSFKFVEDLISRGAEAAVANSAAGKNLLVSRGIDPNKIHVFYNGINPARLVVNGTAVSDLRARIGVPAGGRLVGILANLTRAKDHATFLRAAAQVSVSRPEVRFVIVGDGPLRPALESLAAALGIAERVVFLGFQRQVADCLASCDVLVSSSRDDEGCSNSILEAMFLGTPVIATDAGGNSEVLEHGVTGWITPCQDPRALAHAIERYLADPELTMAISAHARQQADQRFTLARMVANYEGLYRALLGAKERKVARRTAWAQG